jgi:hypothetical protein
MRWVTIFFSALLVLLSASLSATSSWASAPAVKALLPGELGNEMAVQRWMNGYRVRHDLVHVTEAVKALSAMGAFKDPGASGVYVGFLAGILAANPNRVDDLLTKWIAAMTVEDQWVIVEAIAYSGLPNWKDAMRKFGSRMPTRRVMIEKYLAGKMKTLDQMEFDKNLNMWDRFTGYFDFKKHVPGAYERVSETNDASTTVLDTLWGYYFATGSTKPILRIITVLPWSKDRNNVEKLTVGSTAKLTLASNAVRDPVLLAILHHEAKHQPKEVADVLNEVVDAAETAQTERIRKDALADLDEIRRKGSLSKREVVWWGQAGQLAIAGLCVAEAALGNLAFGLPCVIGGGLSSAALQYYGNTQQ